MVCTGKGKGMDKVLYERMHPVCIIGLSNRNITQATNFIVNYKFSSGHVTKVKINT